MRRAAEAFAPLATHDDRTVDRARVDGARVRRARRMGATLVSTRILSTCDVCGAELPEGQAIRAGWIRVFLTLRDQGTSREFDVCAGCRERPSTPERLQSNSLNSRTPHPKKRRIPGHRGASGTLLADGSWGSRLACDRNVSPAPLSSTRESAGDGTRKLASTTAQNAETVHTPRAPDRSSGEASAPGVRTADRSRRRRARHGAS
jgi:hypothetical protein